VRQGVDLDVGLLDPAREGDALLQVPVRVIDSSRPELGGAKAEQRQRAEVLAESRPRRVGHRGRGQQPLRLLDHGREIAPLAGERLPREHEHDLRAVPAVCRQRDESSGRLREMPLRRVVRSPQHLVGRHQGGELRIGRDGAGREPGEDVVRGGRPSGEVQA
jgi:hypothetical protein